MIEDVVVEVEVLESFLFVDAAEVGVPRDLWRGFAVEVDPDEAVDVDVYVDGEETVLGFVEAFEFVVFRCLGELSVKTVRPAVVLY